MAENEKNVMEDELENEASKVETEENADESEANVEEVEEATDGETEAEETEEGEDGEEKEAKKDKKDLLIDELKDKYMRTFAEFDNFRKRSEKEKSAMFEVGAKAIIEKILPIVDSFERGLATVPEEEKEAPFVDGMDKVYKQLITALEDAGVKQIPALGEQFDPNLHNAVMHIEDEEAGENVVIEEFQKGYTYRDSVVRHSMVKVAN